MENKDIYAEISSIKNIMERSTRFISLSGLSGILAGIYALAGAGIAYLILQKEGQENVEKITVELMFVALAVLVLAIGTGVALTIRKAAKKRQKIWTPSSKAMLVSGLVPLLSGGIFAFILTWESYYGLIAPTCLIFYGLAVVASSQHTFNDVRWLGVCEIVLGLLSASIPGYGLIFWAVGFGVLHIIYGSVMYFKYDRENSAQ